MQANKTLNVRLLNQNVCIASFYRLMRRVKLSIYHANGIKTATKNITVQCCTNDILYERGQCPVSTELFRRNLKTLSIQNKTGRKYSILDTLENLIWERYPRPRHPWWTFQSCPINTVQWMQAMCAVCTVLLCIVYTWNYTPPCHRDRNTNKHGNKHIDKINILMLAFHLPVLNFFNGTNYLIN